MRITTLAGVPPLWVQLLEAEWPAGDRSPAQAPDQFGRRADAARWCGGLRARFPAADLYPMYGLTEAFRSTYLDPALIDAHPDAIGRAIPSPRSWWSAPTAAAQAPGEPGELVHAGPLVAQGYWRDPERTAQRFRPAPAWREHGGMAVWSGDTVVEGDGRPVPLRRPRRRDDQDGGQPRQPERGRGGGRSPAARRRGGRVRRPGRAAWASDRGWWSRGRRGRARRHLRATLRTRAAELHAAAGATSGATICRATPTASSIAPRSCAEVSAMKPMGPIPPEFAGEPELTIGGRSADALVAEAGDTPLFVYDIAIVAARIARFRAALPAESTLHYAIKANPLPRCSPRWRRWSTGSTSPRRASLRGAAAASRRPRSASPGPASATASSRRRSSPA